MIRIVIPGTPIAKKRPRFSVLRNKNTGKVVCDKKTGRPITNTYNDQKTEEGRFLHAVEAQVGGAEPIDGPLAVTLRFYMPRPKGHFGSGRNAGRLKASAPRHHVVTPDIDNLEKFVLDCLNGVAFKDDKQIVRVDKAKLYSTNPRTEIVVKGVSQIA